MENKFIKKMSITEFDGLPLPVERIQDELDAKPNRKESIESPPVALPITINPKNSSTPVTSSPLTPSHNYYGIHNQRVGRALIFNHSAYSCNMNPRRGTDADRDRAKKVFENLGLTVQVYNNYTTAALLSELDKVSKEDHSDSDCFVLLIMTHGDKNGVLYAYDGTIKADWLWAPFLGDNCKSLVGKPKMFFLQACRGNSLDAGVKFQTAAVYDEVDTLSTPTKIYFNIPNTADLLLMYSTSEDHYSFRNPDTGSWFVQSLCEVFEKNGPTEDLLSLLTEVNQKVAYNYESNIPGDVGYDKKKQMPVFVSTLTKLFYFKRKHLVSQ